MKFSDYYFDKICGYDYELIKGYKQYQKIILLCKTIVLGFFSRLAFDEKEFSVDFLFFKYHDRMDHNILFEEVYRQCEATKIDVHIKREYIVNIKLVISLVKYISVLRSFIREYKLLVGLYLYIKVNQYYQAVYLLRDCKFFNLVVFTDVHPIEDLLVQYANSNRANSIMLQHGLYIDWDGEVNINSLNYLQVQAKYLLAWGESTKNLFHKYNPDLKILLCGKPTIRANLKVNNIEQTVGVVLDEPLYHKYNQKVINIITDFALQEKWRIILRFHPRDKHTEYNIPCEELILSGDALEASIIVAHTTSMIFEYMTYGKKVYKFKSDIPFYDIDNRIIFSSVDELVRSLNVDFDFKQEAKRHISLIDSVSKDEYKKTFKLISGVSKSEKSK